MRPPISACPACREQYKNQERLGDTVSQLRQLRLRGGSAFHERHNLGKPRLVAGMLDPYDHGGRQIVAAGNHQPAFAARQGPRFTGQQRFISQRAALQNDAIGRKSFARQHPYHIADAQPAHGDAFKNAIRAAPLHAVRKPVHQGFQRACRAVAQTQLQPAPGQQEKYEHREGVEIHFGPKNPGGLESAQRTHDKGNGHAQRDRKVHADAAVAQVTQGIPEKRCAGKQQDRQRKHPGRPAQQVRHVRRQVTRIGDVGRPCIHHDLHHAQPRHAQPPQGLTRLDAPAVIGKGVVGGHRRITCAGRRLHPAGGFDGLV